jgi:hypothetical protein
MLLWQEMLGCCIGSGWEWMKIIGRELKSRGGEALDVGAFDSKPNTWKYEYEYFHTEFGEWTTSS